MKPDLIDTYPANGATNVPTNATLTAHYDAEAAYCTPAFKTVLERLAEVWRTERARVMEQGAKITEMLRNYSAPKARHGAELHGVVVEVDESTGHATAIRRIALT